MEREIGDCSRGDSMAETPGPKSSPGHPALAGTHSRLVSVCVCVCGFDRAASTHWLSKLTLTAAGASLMASRAAALENLTFLAGAGAPRGPSPRRCLASLLHQQLHGNVATTAPAYGIVVAFPLTLCSPLEGEYTSSVCSSFIHLNLISVP